MATTPNFNLDLQDPGDINRTLFDWVEKLSGKDSTSNMMVIDSILNQLQSQKANKVVESATEPTGLATGDEWDRVIEEVENT